MVGHCFSKVIDGLHLLGEVVVNTTTWGTPLMLSAADLAVILDTLGISLTILNGQFRFSATARKDVADKIADVLMRLQVQLVVK